MPIVDIEWVAADTDHAPTAQALADAVGLAFGAAPGRVWVRLHRLPAADYAENGVGVGNGDANGARPVFVGVQHAHAPQGDARDAELAAITAAVAAAFGRDPGRVHVRYAASAAGHQAFGGRWVR
jgi:phenylpyruvate tautomerase PptA (4-oxalocrotonate tautomerase family)